MTKIKDIHKLAVEHYSHQFRWINKRIPQEWEELPRFPEWDFITFFLQGYEGRGDVAMSYDLASVLNNDHKYKDLKWLRDAYPKLEKYNKVQLKLVLKNLDEKLLKQAKVHFYKALRNRKIEVRKFLMGTTSARIESKTGVWLWYNQENIENGICVDQMKLQNIVCRTCLKEDEIFQILLVDEVGKKQWMYAQNIDFE